MTPVLEDQLSKIWSSFLSKQRSGEFGSIGIEPNPTIWIFAVRVPVPSIEFVPTNSEPDPQELKR